MLIRINHRTGAANMVPCKVEWYNNWPVLLVTFGDGRTLLLQSDWDYIAFCYACGAPIGSGDPSSSDYDAAAWERFDVTTITQCPDEYLELAA
jgi:hypothetical protein